MNVTETVPALWSDEQTEELRARVQRAVQRQDTDTALRLLEEAREESESCGDLRLRSTTMTLTGYVYRYVDKHQESLEALQSACGAWANLGDKRGQAENLKQLAITLAHWSRDEEAIQHLEHALLLFQQMGDRAGEVAVQANLGNFYKKVGDIATAQEMMHLALAYFEEVGNTLNAARTRMNIANNYNILNEPAEALLHAERALKTFEELKNNHDTCMALTVVGTAYALCEQPETALELFHRGLALLETFTADWLKAVTLSNIGDALVRLKRYDDALDALEAALEVNGKNDHVLAFAECLERLGVLYATSGFSRYNPDKSLQLLLEAKEIMETAGMMHLKVRILNALADTYEQMGDTAQALMCYRAMHHADKLLFNQASDRRIRSLKVRFELEQAHKDAEIAQLRSVELANALAEAERLRALADEQARTDALTGVYNRRCLDERLANEFTRANRYKRPLTVALVDVDYFKKINDTFGHAVGDDALRRVSAILRANCRTCDTVARYGGEEFAVLAPETDCDEASAFCERIRFQVETENWNRIAPGLHVTLSIGFCTMSADDWLDQLVSPKLGTKFNPHRLMASADANLYAAKQSGRNRIVG